MGNGLVGAIGGGGQCPGLHVYGCSLPSCRGPYGYGDPDRFPMYGDPGHGGGMIFDPMREGGRSRMVPPEFRPPAW